MTTATKYPVIIMNTMLPLVVTMDPNPQSLKVQYEKVFSQTRTLGGWSFEHWGEKPGRLSINGRTRAMLDDGDFVSGAGNGTLPNPLAALQSSSEFKVETAFFALKQIYKLDKRKLNTLMTVLSEDSPIVSDILNGTLDPASYSTLATSFIYYKYDIYKGFFTSFNWQQDSQLPRVYTYDFNFLVTATLQDFLVDSLLSIPGIAGASVATTFGVALSAAEMSGSNV